MNRSLSRKMLAVLLVLAAGASAAVPAHAADKAALTASRDKAITYMNGKLGGASQFKLVLDWPALTLYAAGENATGPRWSTAAGQNGVTWRANDLLRTVNISEATTDFESVLLGALAARQNPRSFGKKDLVSAIVNAQLPNGKFADSIKGYGEDLLNSHIYGIIALYAAAEPIPNQEKARAYLLSKQHADGGFNWSTSSESDPDVTAMALIAMKALGIDPSDPSVTKALSFLKTNQKDSGGFASLGTENSDTSTIVVEALLMWNLDLSTWARSNGNPVDTLLTYQNGDGSFSHVKGQSGSNMMATQNGALALSDLLAGKSVYQRLHDENASKDHMAWQPAFPDLPFTHPYYADNMKLVNLGVLNGRTDGRYSPDEGVTREQFAKILTLGESEWRDKIGPRTSQFRDVDLNGWANPYIKLAYDKKIMLGTSETTFAPTDSINGAQVMTILVRMLGLEAQAKSYMMQDHQGWPYGHVKVAKELGLWYPNFNPDKSTTRAEVGYSYVRYYEEQAKRASN
jgi:prenyltransferase beta subunit